MIVNSNSSECLVSVTLQSFKVQLFEKKKKSYPLYRVCMFFFFSLSFVWLFVFSCCVACGRTECLLPQNISNTAACREGALSAPRGSNSSSLGSGSPSPSSSFAHSVDRKAGRGFDCRLVTSSRMHVYVPFVSRRMMK